MGACSLRNGDVENLTARTSVCATSKVFAQAIDIVQSTLGEAEDRRTSRNKPTYDMLIKKFRLGRPRTLMGWMTDVEAEFAHSCRRYDAGNPNITCAIFYWVCKKAKVLASLYRYDRRLLSECRYKEMGWIHLPKSIESHNELLKTFSKSWIKLALIMESGSGSRSLHCANK